jgi:succinate dehydrogenase (ubiquinone) cytochrome b560 subunit
LALVWLLVKFPLNSGLYVAAPLYVIKPFSSADVVFYAHNNPTLLKVGKVLAAFPFVYHSLNGIRHLIWDAGYQLSLKGVYATGYAVQAGTVAGTAYAVLKE